MSEEIKFDHFKNIEELLHHIDIWYKEDDIDYTRWFHLEDLKKVKDYITDLQQENKQLKEKIDKAIEKVKDISFKFTSDKFWYCVVLSTTTDGKELLEILGGSDESN